MISKLFQKVVRDFPETHEMRHPTHAPVGSAQGGGGGAQSSRAVRRPRPLWDEFDYFAHRENFAPFADNNGEWGDECLTQKWATKCNP